MRDLPFILFRISGWVTNISTLLICYFTVKSRNMWRGRFTFLAIDFCFIAVLELLALISDLLRFNNLWINGIYVAGDFTLLMLYFTALQRSATVKLISRLIICLSIAFSVFNAISFESYKKYDVLGMYINMSVIFIYSLWNLTILFQEHIGINKLRNNPDFWFVGTTFCLCFFDSFITILSSVAHADNADVFYLIYVPRNFIHAILFFGYYRGIRLLG